VTCNSDLLELFGLRWVDSETLSPTGQSDSADTGFQGTGK